MTNRVKTRKKMSFPESREFSVYASTVYKGLEGPPRTEVSIAEKKIIFRPT